MTSNFAATPARLTISFTMSVEMPAGLPPCAKLNGGFCSVRNVIDCACAAPAQTASAMTEMPAIVFFDIRLALPLRAGSILTTPPAFELGNIPREEPSQEPWDPHLFHLRLHL